MTRREYERALKIAPKFIGELNEHGTKSYQEWTEARPANDFGRARSNLEKTLDLSRQLADHLAGYEHIADPLIDFADYGMMAASVHTLFADLREKLVPIVHAITSQSPADGSVLSKHYPEADQLAFGAKVVRELGYDFNRGRIDKTHHPFMTKFSLGDVRVTTRVKEKDFGDYVFSNMHEAGHTMYEQAIDMAYEGLPLGGGTSAGVHESQSRLWENIVCRSRSFWEYMYPKVQANSASISRMCRWIRSTLPSTRSRSRSFAPMQMKPRTACM